MSAWIVPVLMSLIVALLIAVAVIRARDTGGMAEDAGQDLEIYRKQLAEIEKDREKGTVPAEESDRLHAEIARRLIAADSRAARTSGTNEPTRLRPALVVGLIVVLLGAPLALYARIGAPGYGDLSLKDRLTHAEERRETRPDQQTAEAASRGINLPQREIPPPDFEALIEKLRIAVLERPDDLQGQQLLARNEAALGNFRAAYGAQEQVLRLRDGSATADDYLAYADLMILAAGGYVSPQAENALRAALSRDPDNAPARYYLGLMMRQNDRPDVAFRLWDQLLRAGPETAPWIPPIRTQIDEAAMLAGVDYEQPLPAETLSGPTAQDIANARDLTEEDRAQMIEGMVERLSDRLATQGGSAQEWARLINAYGVLGDTTRAGAIAAEARQVFAASPDALSLIAEAEAALPQETAPQTPVDDENGSALPLDQDGSNPPAASPIPPTVTGPEQPGPEQDGPEQDRPEQLEQDQPGTDQTGQLFHPPLGQISAENIPARVAPQRDDPIQNAGEITDPEPPMQLRDTGPSPTAAIGTSE